MKIIILFLLLASAVVTGSCDGGCKGDVVGPTSFGFRLLDKNTQKDLLGIYGIYSINYVKILDKNGNKISETPFAFDGQAVVVAFASPFEADVYTTPITREFYLHLTPSDIDTIKVEFTFQKVGKQNCLNNIVNHLKVWYNDSLYVHTNTDRVSLNFLKKP